MTFTADNDNKRTSTMTKCKDTEGKVKLQSWKMDDVDNNNGYKILKEEHRREPERQSY